MGGQAEVRFEAVGLGHQGGLASCYDFFCSVARRSCALYSCSGLRTRSADGHRVGFAARVADRLKERPVVRASEAQEDCPGRAVLLELPAGASA